MQQVGDSESLSERYKRLVAPGNKVGSDMRDTAPTEDWRPRMDVDMSRGGFVVSSPRTSTDSPDAVSALHEFDLNPAEWLVTSVRRSKWQRYDGEWLESVRVNIVPASQSDEQNNVDIEQLLEEIKKWKPPKTKTTSGDCAFVIVASDQQLGKRANGEGTPESYERILKLTDSATTRLTELRKSGRSIGTIVLALLGDHVEGNTSQNGKLQSVSASDLGMTEQVRVGRRILLHQIKTLAPLCDELVVAVVNGNHDEVTRQVATDPSDGWNVEIASQVQDICSEVSSLSHVVFRFPSNGHQTLTVEVCGTMLGMFHGHQFRGDVTKFLSQQASGQTALGMADVWISGHYHHFQAKDLGQRLWLQAPTTDPGSEWFRDSYGFESPQGILTFTIGKTTNPRRDINVLGIKRI